MMVHRGLFFSILAALGCVVPLEAAAAQSGERPNIIYIMSDDHASHAISCYGSKINQTPNLDRLAKEGMRFDNFFCTNSICGPCRAVVLTGKYNHKNGFIDNGSVFDGSQQHVAKLLQKAGYQTAVVGKWHLVSEPTGFDFWHILQGQGPYYNPLMLTAEGKVPHTGYTTDIITDVALDYLKNRDSSKPFFLMYHHKAPHRNWMPGPKYLDLYDDVTMPEPENLFDDYSGRGTAARDQQMSIEKDMNESDLKLGPPGENLTPEQREAFIKAYADENAAFEKAHLQGDELVRWKYQRYIKDYCRAIASVDENVGRMLDYLDKEGLADNTIVIYTSDQGFYLGDHGWFDKRFMYEESLRSPFLIRWPRHIQPGSVNKDIVLNLDLAETFLDAAGQQPPADMQGRSFKAILDGQTPADWRKSMYYRYYEFPQPHHVHPHYGVRTDRYKLIYFHDLDEWELYDLEKDPKEMKSVYADAAYADIVKELKVELQRLKAEYQDNDGVERFQPAGARPASPVAAEAMKNMPAPKAKPAGKAPRKGRPGGKKKAA